MTTWRSLAKVRSPLSWVARWRGLYATIAVEEEPDTLETHAVYVVGEDAHQWFAAFDCPCGCGQRIKLSLIPDDRPGWKLREHWNGTVSLAPSVWRQVGCKSHFWLRKGRINWC